MEQRMTMLTRQRTSSAFPVLPLRKPWQRQTVQSNRVGSAPTSQQQLTRQHVCMRASPRPNDEPQVAVLDSIEDAEPQSAPFLDSMLRSIALGFGMGVLVELGHVLFQCVAVGRSLPDLIPDGALEQLLTPIRTWDNLAAMGGTVVFYIVEVAAILAVLKQYPNDNKSAYQALQRSPTLPKRLMPVSLSRARRVLYSLMSGKAPSLMPSTASLLDLSGSLSSIDGAAKAAVAATLPPPVATQFASAVGTAVLERPPAAAPQAPPPPPLRGGDYDEDDGTGGSGSNESSTPRGGFLPKPPLGERVGAPPRPTKPGLQHAPRLLPGRKPALKKLPTAQVPPASLTPGAAARPPPTQPPASRPANLPPGGLDSYTQQFLMEPALTWRNKELRDRRAYLKNFWYAAAVASDLKPGKALEVEILGRTVALYRDEATGKPVCLDNVCPHRGAPLARGWLEQHENPHATSGCSTSNNGSTPASSSSSSSSTSSTCLVCPYHGWAFDATGRLRNVPSQDDQKALPRRPLLDTYPVEERGGFIWLFFGSSSLPMDERPPIPMCPELEDPTWHKVYGEIEFECPHWGVYDNMIDMAHVHYLHDDTFGNKGKPMIRDMDVAMTEYGVKADFKIYNKPVSKLWEWTAVQSVPVEATSMLPSSSAVKNYLGAGVSMVVFLNVVPITASRTMVRFCHIRNFAGWDGLDAWARNAMIRILKEDKVMVEELRHETVRHEVSLQADMIQVAYRKVRQTWIDMGYGVDPEATIMHTGSLDM